MLAPHSTTSHWSSHLVARVYLICIKRVSSHFWVNHPGDGLKQVPYVFCLDALKLSSHGYAFIVGTIKVFSSSLILSGSFCTLLLIEAGFQEIRRASRKAVEAAYCDGRPPFETEVRELTAYWGAAAGMAQQLLLDVLSRGL